MSSPCFVCQSVLTMDASASTQAVWERNAAGYWEQTFGRVRLIASCSAMIASSSKRRQKSPAVVRSGSDGVSRPSKRTASPRRASKTSERLPPPGSLRRCSTRDRTRGRGDGPSAGDRGVDLARQPERIDPAGNHADPTMRDPPVALGPLIAVGLPQATGRPGSGPPHRSGAARSPSVRAQACVAFVASRWSSRPPLSSRRTIGGPGYGL